MPQPMHSDSEMYTMGLVFSTSMQSFPIRTTGHDFLHSCWTRRPSEERDVTKERTEPKRGKKRKVCACWLQGWYGCLFLFLVLVFLVRGKRAC